MITTRLTTSPLRKRAAVMAAGLVLLGAFAAPASAKGPQEEEPPKKDDIVVYRDGGVNKQKEGTIESATLDGVKISGRGGGTIEASQIVRIDWAKAPPQYAAGWRALSQRNGRAAKNAFTTVLQAKAAGVVAGDWPEEYANVGLGEAHLLIGVDDKSAFDAAISAFEAAKAANAKSVILDRIHRGLADASLGKGDTAGALRHVDALISAAKAARRADWEVDAYFVKADVQRAKGNPSGATQAYADAGRASESALNSAKDATTKAFFESRRRRAAAAEGWVLVDKALESRSSADFDAARSYFEGLPAKFGAAVEVQAAVENAMGVVKFANDKTYEALRHFQTTEVLYFGVPSEVARSLYYQAECWEKLGDETQRSSRLRDLKAYYPKSEWARK